MEKWESVKFIEFLEKRLPVPEWKNHYNLFSAVKGKFVPLLNENFLKDFGLPPATCLSILSLLKEIKDNEGE